MSMAIYNNVVGPCSLTCGRPQQNRTTGSNPAPKEQIICTDQLPCASGLHICTEQLPCTSGLYNYSCWLIPIWDPFYLKDSLFLYGPAHQFRSFSETLLFLTQLLEGENRLSQKSLLRCETHLSHFLPLLHVWCTVFLPQVKMMIPSLYD